MELPRSKHILSSTASTGVSFFNGSMSLPSSLMWYVSSSTGKTQTLNFSRLMPLTLRILTRSLPEKHQLIPSWMALCFLL